MGRLGRVRHGFQPLPRPGSGGYRLDRCRLRRAGVLHTGSFRSAAAQRRITMLTVRDVKVAFLAYTEMTNGIAPPHPWSVNLARAGTIRADARRARAQGAQVVVVNIHWGTNTTPGRARSSGGLPGRSCAATW